MITSLCRSRYHILFLNYSTLWSLRTSSTYRDSIVIRWGTRSQHIIVCFSYTTVRLSLNAGRTAAIWIVSQISSLSIISSLWYFHWYGWLIFPWSLMTVCSLRFNSYTLRLIHHYLRVSRHKNSLVATFLLCRFSRDSMSTHRRRVGSTFALG